MNVSKFLVSVGLALALAGCMSAAEHRKAVQSEVGDRVTVGKRESGPGPGLALQNALHFQPTFVNGLLGCQLSPDNGAPGPGDQKCLRHCVALLT